MFASQGSSVTSLNTLGNKNLVKLLPAELNAIAFLDIVVRVQGVSQAEPV